MQTNNAIITTVKAYRRYLLIGIPAVLLQLILFKLFYPFASYFFTDSFSYIFTAAANADAGTWPVGYSKFLRVFNTFLHSDTALFCFQYLMLEAGAFYFFYTLIHYFRPSRWMVNLLFLFLIINPPFLYISNCVSSDALFLALSLIWFAQLIAAMDRLSWGRIGWQAVLLLILFSFRYAAIYYPFVAALGILLSRAGAIRKITAIVLPFALLGCFIIYSRGVNREMTGVESFSPFGGWQLANNALYMYGDVRGNTKARKEVPAPAAYAALDGMVGRFFDTTQGARKTLFDPDFPGIYYQWSLDGPLMAYLNTVRKKDTSAAYFKAWSQAGDLYNGYGKWLIREYPLTYMKDFVWPNAIRYGIPLQEFMGKYNAGQDTVEAIAQYWFHYKNNRVKAASKSFQALLLSPYPVLNLVVLLFYVLIFLLFLSAKDIRQSDPSFLRYSTIVCCLWVCHTGFSVLAAPVVLRYQLFFMTICFSFSLLTIGHLLKAEAGKKVEPAPPVMELAHSI